MAKKKENQQKSNDKPKEDLRTSREIFNQIEQRINEMEKITIEWDKKKFERDKKKFDDARIDLIRRFRTDQIDVMLYYRKFGEDIFESEEGEKFSYEVYGDEGKMDVDSINFRKPIITIYTRKKVYKNVVMN